LGKCPLDLLDALQLDEELQGALKSFRGTPVKPLRGIETRPAA